MRPRVGAVWSGLALACSPAVASAQGYQLRLDAAHRPQPSAAFEPTVYSPLLL